MAAIVAPQVNLSPMKDSSIPIADEVVVGKDVLELLAGAMYVDPLTVYREYIQNAADAIDEARIIVGTSKEIDNVTISFDHAARSIRIRDLGAGVPNADFVRRLTSIGASPKRGDGKRGFRGVGRLSGLGYCQELVFRSRSIVDAKVQEMRWNGRLLREKLRDTSFKGSLGDLIREVASIKTLSGVEYPSHFFEVEMLKVLRIRNDVLMNEEAVRNYISQVAPVPFDPAFSFGVPIANWLADRGVSPPISVTLEDGKGPIFHRAVSQFPASKTALEAFAGVEFLEFKDADDNQMAFGWILDHSYAGALPKKPRLGGIRLRAGNIQVGDEWMLGPYFKELRFAAWAMGEIHISHPRIVPNGRRDEFEAGPHYSDVQEELRTLAGSIAQKIRGRSEERNRLKKISLLIGQAEVWLACSTNKRLHKLIRRLSVTRAHTIADEADAKLKRAGDQHHGYQIARERLDKILRQAKRSEAQYRTGTSKGRKSVAEIAVFAILENASLPHRVVPFAEKLLVSLESRKG